MPGMVNAMQRFSVSKQIDRQRKIEEISLNHNLGIFLLVSRYEYLDCDDKDMNDTTNQYIAAEK